MKKLLTATLAALLCSAVLAGNISAGQYAQEQITAIKAEQAPAIDGEIDAVWEYTEAVSVEKFGSNIYPNTSTAEAHKTNPVATAEIKAMWDANHLYVLGIVTDPTPNKTATNTGDENIDGVDIQISEDNEQDGAMRDDTVGGDNTLPGNGNFNININGKATGWGGVWFAAGGGEKVVSAAKDTDTGYIFEAAIPLQTITGEVGTVIGVEFQINDNQDGSGRTAIRQWNSDTCDAHSNAAYLGECVFIEAPVIETVAADEPAAEAVTTAPQTLDAGVLAAAAAVISAVGYAVSKRR